MSKGTVNKVIILGRLGADPETRYSAAGKAMTTFNVATNHSRRDPDSGEWQDQTEWHRMVLFERQAEVAAQYLRKGNQAYFEGRLQTRKWTGNDGVERYTTEIIVNELTLLGSREESAAAPAYPYAAPPQQPPAARPPAAPPARSAPPPAPSAPPTAMNPPTDFDDDIPF